MVRHVCVAKWVVVLLAICTAIGWNSTSDAASGKLKKRSLKTQKKLNPRKMKADFERTRREMKERHEERKREIKANRSQSTNGSASKVAPPTQNQNRFSYHVANGQAFAYAVVIQWQEGGKQIQIVGRPYYQVRHQTNGKSTVLVIGRYRYLVKSSKEEQFRYVPSKDYWVEAAQVLAPQGFEYNGRKGTGSFDLPYLMENFINLRRLISPKLPYATNAKESREENAVLTRTANGTTLWSGFSSSGKSGREMQSVEAKEISSSNVQLDIRHGYTEGTGGISAIYQSRATFNPSAGLLDKSQGTYQLIQNGKTLNVSVVARRLSGTEFSAAKKSALQDLDAMPKGSLPAEIMRTPLSSKLRQSYSLETLPSKGTAVAYYDKTMNQPYRVIYLGRNAEGKVGIRFEGSGEQRMVRPSAISKIGSSK